MRVLIELHAGVDGSRRSGGRGSGAKTARREGELSLRSERQRTNSGRWGENDSGGRGCGAAVGLMGAGGACRTRSRVEGVRLAHKTHGRWGAEGKGSRSHPIILLLRLREGGRHGPSSRLLVGVEGVGRSHQIALATGAGLGASEGSTEIPRVGGGVVVARVREPLAVAEPLHAQEDQQKAEKTC